MALGACGDLHRSEERAILLRHLQELPTLYRELMALLYCRWQRIRIGDGMGAETARSVWRMEPGDKGFWSRVIGFAFVLGSARNLPHVLVILHGMRTFVIALPLVLAGVAVASLLRWPREWRRVLRALIGALFPQDAGLTAHMSQQGGPVQGHLAELHRDYRHPLVLSRHLGRDLDWLLPLLEIKKGEVEESPGVNCFLRNTESAPTRVDS